MNNIEKLIEMFRSFPGIGPRQAKRFVYFLLARTNGYNKELGRLIQNIQSEVSTCSKCFRFFTPDSKSQISLCQICKSQKRDDSQLLIVPHDVDFENMDKSGGYNGYYFILGGTVPILDKNPEQKIRQTELLKVLDEKSKNGLKEIIVAMNYNPEGEHTFSYLNSLLAPFCQKYSVKISTLGRGLSTGTELEYSDSETIKNALKNRS